MKVCSCYLLRILDDSKAEDASRSLLDGVHPGARALGSHSTLAYAKRVRVSLKGQMNASLQQIDHSENAARCNCHSLAKVAVLVNVSKLRK